MKIRLGKTGKHTVSCAWSMERANSFDEMRQDKMYSAEQSRTEQCSGVQSRAVQCSRVQGCENEYRVYRAIHTVNSVIRYTIISWDSERREEKRIMERNIKQKMTEISRIEYHHFRRWQEWLKIDGVDWISDCMGHLCGWQQARSEVWSLSDLSMLC